MRKFHVLTIDDRGCTEWVHSGDCRQAAVRVFKTEEKATADSENGRVIQVVFVEAIMAHNFRPDLTAIGQGK